MDLHGATVALMAPGPLERCFAWRRGQAVSRGQFLAHVESLAGDLPDARYALNLCEDRYNFTVSFCAVVLRGQSNLLPPNRSPLVVAQVSRLHGDHYLIGEGTGHADATRWFDVGHRLAQPGAAAHTIPRIPAEHTAVVTFTSGSTGEPRPYPKRWGALSAAAADLSRHVHALAGPLSGMVATVPPQHMYGLEAGVMLPLRGGICMWSAAALFPADVCNALRASGESPLLVTTPVHLRALTRANLAMPRCALALSATAPLDAGLAAAAEAALCTRVHEVYGSTETGAIAGRRTLDGPSWTPFSGVRVTAGKGGLAQVRSVHQDAAAALGDIVHVHPDGRFELVGRDADLLDIAGKRASLGDLNCKLLAIPGVHDGVFLAPEDAAPHAHPPRLGALVVAPKLSREALVSALRKCVDPAFVPRRVVFLEHLPRDTTGKLRRRALMECWNRRDAARGE